MINFKQLDKKDLNQAEENFSWYSLVEFWLGTTEDIKPEEMSETKIMQIASWCEQHYQFQTNKAYPRLFFCQRVLVAFVEKERNHQLWWN